MKRAVRHLLVCLVTSVVASFWVRAQAQTGVDDDRVSLPAGPGSLEGVGDDVEIDPNMGSMSHRIPFILPAGFPGATPNLGLSYSSAAPASAVGIGWSMSAPAIGRMTSRGAPTYTTDDRFDFDGRELVYVGDLDGERIYRARFEGDFVRYRWVNAGQGAAGFWVTDNPDGSRSYFGAGANRRDEPTARRSKDNGETAEYCLVATVDPYGNSVQYTYANLDGSVPLLTGISWLPDANANPTYRVFVGYEPRPDLLSDASRGFEELTANRVQRVRVLNGQEIIREYVLDYEDGQTSGGFTRLSRVQQYGRGGESGGHLYPIVQSFAYSQALGVECTGDDCDRPYLVKMGQLSGGVTLTGGRATLIDINADALPDVLDTSRDGAHRFFINTLRPDGNGGFTHTFAPPTDSAVGTGAQRLGLGFIQVFDVNGDGRSDLLNASTGTWLENGGNGDWAGAAVFGDVGALRNLDFDFVRFVDVDDDKRVDLITSTSQSSTLYRNDGNAFVTDSSIMPLRAALGGRSTLQFADMNGDGLNDPVEILSDGRIRYRLNLGRGQWSIDWRVIANLTISPNNVSRADFEDINGDGVSDIVVVGARTVQYAINRNGDRFDPFVPITSDDIGGAADILPERVATTTVLFADMNANGSSDVVWITAAGEVTYLELFPRRPNLLTRIDNGIGSVQEISYLTAAEAAATADATNTPWQHHLSIPMQLVHRLDRYVTLTGSADGTGLHEITEYEYRDGFYDGVEKQYRGFERVAATIAQDEFHEQSVVRRTYDVGRVAPHRNGLALTETTVSAGRVLMHLSNTYSDCSIESGVRLGDLNPDGVFFPCLTSEDIVYREGLSEAEAKTVRTTMTYDGYGNVALKSELGVVDEPGDELYTWTEYVTPSPRWLIGLPARERVYHQAIDGSTPASVGYAENSHLLRRHRLRRRRPQNRHPRLCKSSDSTRRPRHPRDQRTTCRGHRRWSGQRTHRFRMVPSPTRPNTDDGIPMTAPAFF